MQAEELAPDAQTSAESPLRLLHPIAAFLVVASVTLAEQLKTPGLADPDGFYHIRWSRVLWENLQHGRLAHFVWLPLTSLNERSYADHHFLFHLLQIPFAWDTDIVSGAKTSAVIYGSLAYLACYALIVRERVRYPFAWLLLLVASSANFLFRMSLPRAPALMVALLAVVVWLLVTKRYWWLAAAGFVAVWLYSLFPLVGVFAVLWTIARWIETRRIEWQPVAAAAIGIAAGLVINPYFPNNLLLLVEHARMVTAKDVRLATGTEWDPGSWSLMANSAGACLAQIAGWVLLTRRENRRSAGPVFFGLVSTLLAVLTIFVSRFVEYWPPFAVLFLAVASKPLLESVSWPSLSPRARAGAVAALAAAALVAVAPLYVFLTRVPKPVRGLYPQLYAGGTQWLAENTPEGSLVYNVSWEDFPPLFCFDPHNVYVSGLDTNYLHDTHPDLALLFQNIAAGTVDQPAAAIRDRFGARYVFAFTESKDFLVAASREHLMQIAYQDRYAYVFYIPDDQAPPAVAPPPAEPATP